jgi:hypothetical protein
MLIKLISTHVPYAALSRKNILPENGRIVAAETCRRVYKCIRGVAGFINKLAVRIFSHCLFSLLRRQGLYYDTASLTLTCHETPP